MFGKFFSGKSKPVAVEQDQDDCNYCPSCGDEFRAEFKHCSSCDVELIPAAGNKGNTLNSTKEQVVAAISEIQPEEENLVPVRQGTLMELKQVKRLLAKHGVASVLMGDGPDGAKGCCGSSTFILHIREENLVLAGSVLSEDFRRATALDTHSVSAQPEVVFDERTAEINCPACGNSFSPEEQTCPECGLCFQAA